MNSLDTYSHSGKEISTTLESSTRGISADSCHCFHTHIPRWRQLKDLPSDPRTLKKYYIFSNQMEKPLPDGGKVTQLLSCSKSRTSAGLSTTPHLLASKMVKLKEQNRREKGIQDQRKMCDEFWRCCSIFETIQVSSLYPNPL